MKKVIIGIQIQNRFEEVEKVQNLLTESGCIIKTRLGLHQQAEYDAVCTEKGLLLLEIVRNAENEAHELISKLSEIDGVEVRSMEF